MKKELTSIDVDHKIIERLEKKILQLFRDEIYIPLARELDAEIKTIKNSSDPFMDAIRSGRLTFYRGQFRGKLNAKLTLALKKLGAKWDKKHGCFTIHASSLPAHVRDAIEVSESKWNKTVSRVNDLINKFLPEKIADKLNVSQIFDDQIFKVDADISSKLAGMTVTQKLTDSQRVRIAEEYTNNMKLDIKKWAEKEIVSLRKKVEKNVFAGVRYEEMIDTIQRSYDVSESKAKFLARQETHLLNVNLQKERYKSAGVEKYRWQTVVGSPKHPVRHTHKILDGKIFTWDNPPVTDEKGNRNHPGQDYGCRCRARPIVEF